MPKPLRSEILNPPNRQFAHFGVLDTGGQNRTAFFGSIVFNVILALIAVIIGASVKKTIDNRKKLELTFVKPIEKAPEPPKVKIPPPPKLPPPPKVLPTPEPPKIKLPDPPKMPDPPKPIPVVQPKPLPVVIPAPPKIQQAAAAPKVMSVKLPAQSAAVPNNDAHPSAVALGHPDSPVPHMSGPAVAPINMGRGMSGMPPGNSGAGNPTKVVLGGNGSPDGRLGGTAPAAVQGVKIGGCIGCNGTGPGNGTGTQIAQVKIPTAVAAAPPATTVARTSARTPPQVIFKPRPTYTSEATSLHIEGTVIVKIHVSASGQVTVLSVEKGLGHGLDESARQCAQGIRFKPAVDSSGNPIDWEGVVNITFQMA